MIEVRHLRLVRAICEEGGITRAGRRLHLTQSALSCQLREIEADLGAKLFLRLPRRMVPTETGERLLRALEISRGHGCPDPRAMASLGVIELGRRRVDAAARWFSEVSNLVRTGAVAPDPALAKRLEQFARALRSVNRAADAERYQAEAMRLRTKALIETEALRALNYSELWKGNRQ